MEILLKAVAALMSMFFLIGAGGISEKGRNSGAELREVLRGQVITAIIIAITLQILLVIA